ncbi:hypothetical protein [Candidatus Magnetominusculus xianensis]|uniref:hypothetical protein n=1 Tax=Candidatus Magnetominusculus xianensis TaxID=1748249 RepID=UPI00338EB3C2
MAVITGSASTLLERNMALDSGQKHELLLSIYEEAEHLNQIIRNMLNKGGTLSRWMLMMYIAR